MPTCAPSPAVRALAVAGLLALLALEVTPQGLPPGVSREEMWYAPTAEDWKKPCLITWQRTYEDALALSKETGKPILVCVNMDGEIASEHYAGVRYRQPEIAALYEPYVTVIASTYRHSPRDYDENGRRIECPRFGSVTCGEHIAIEPGLFQQFLDGERVAPRHIGVELDGAEMYDVYYAFDTDSVFAAIKEGAAGRPEPPEKPTDRTLVEQVASPDSVDKTAVEELYAEGDRALRAALLDAAMQMGGDAPVDLLRLALFGFDAELTGMARQALTRTNQTQAVDLILEALSDPLATGERDALIGALARLGQSSPRARTLAVVHKGLADGTSVVDGVGWLEGLEGASMAIPPAERPEDATTSETLARQDAILAGADAAAHTDLARAFLASAYAQFVRDPSYSQLLLMDARRTARRAAELGATGWPVNATLAIASYYLGDRRAAHAHAVKAVKTGTPRAPASWDAMAVLAIFAQARQEALARAVREGREWPPEWVSDVHTACSVLSRHPFGTAEQMVGHYDFLRSLGAKREARLVLEDALAAFPDALDLHDRLRRRVLAEQGIDALERTYDELLARSDASPNLGWFAGYASLLTAEFRRRTGDDEQAVGAYRRAIEHFELDIARHPDSRAVSDHQVAVAFGGLARLAFEAGDDPRCLELLLESFRQSPDSASTLDGLNLSAIDTARLLRARLLQKGAQDLVDVLDGALAELDPLQLEPPAYEPRGAAGQPSKDARAARARRTGTSGGQRP